MTITPLAASPARTRNPHPRAVPVEPRNSPRTGADLADVQLDPAGFWGRRQHTNSSATIEHCAYWMQELGWLENFDRIGRNEPTVTRAGWEFSDSEVYKLLEAITWELGRAPDEDLAALYADLVARVSAAQDADGYLSTAFGHAGLPGRYSDMAMGHELYNIGHLLQAAVARLRTHGPDELVEVARRAADHVCDVFGPSGRAAICGHPEIEVGLMELGRALGEQRYTEQATVFLDRRGAGTLPVRPLLSAEYFQDDLPIRDAEVLRGHAVRALYLSAAAVDAAVDNDDPELLRVLRSQWARTVERRTYLTGGMGSRHQDEGFGDDFELPADRAYCETCAGIGSIMFSWRLYLATGDVRYPDLIERTLYNVVATSPAEDGRAFFYANPLHQRTAGSEAEAGVNTRAEGGVRAPWFDVSCCPTNVARTLASLGAYTAATDDGTAVLLQYAAGSYRVGTLSLRVDTRYPTEGWVKITVTDGPDDGAALRLRIPEWARGTTVTVSGREAESVARGWVDVPRLRIGDEIDVVLDISPRISWPDPRIDAVRGTVAVERGPLVLCAESVDLPAGVHLDGIRVRTDEQPRDHGDGALLSAVIADHALRGAGDLPYGQRPLATASGEIPLTLVPYHRWAQRGPATMRVFLPTADGMTTTPGARP